MKTLLITVVSMGMCMIFAGALYSAEGQGIGLDSLIAQALENNPQVQASFQAWKSEEYKIKRVSSLPDPTVSYAYFGKNIETRVGPQESKYGASLKFPFPGKLGNKARAQEKAAQMFKEEYEQVKREVIQKVKFVYFDIFWVDRALQITEEEKSILEGLERVAQRKYESNRAPQQDVIKAQVELSRLIERLSLLRQNRNSLVARMNSLLSRPQDTPLGIFKAVEPQEFPYTKEQLHVSAGQSADTLQKARLNVERAEFEKSLANLDYFPDFTLGVDYIRVGAGHTMQPNDGEDAWAAKLGISVPIWFDKLNAQVKEKKASLEASKAGLKDAENSLAFDVEDLYFKIVTYKDIILLYKTALIPQTEQAFEAAKIGYETGRVDFLNLLDSERILLQTRLAYYKAIVDYQKSIAYLEKVVGRDL